MEIAVNAENINEVVADFDNGLLKELDGRDL